MVGVYEGDEANRLKESILAKQSSKMAAVRGQREDALAQCHTVLHRAGRWEPHF